MAFESVAGQQEAARRLRSALSSGRLPHAYLFVGSAGTGRSAMARELARVVLCESRPGPTDYCGECVNCRLLEKGSHPDYREVGLPEGRQLLSIDLVREIQHAAALKPVRGPRRVFIVRDAERLSADAANCFLKTLEEPPGGCFFVLIASSLHLLPETVASRCCRVRFANLPPDELERMLREEGADAADATWLARRAWGSPGLARRFREEGLHEFNRELVGRLGKLTLERNFEMSDWLAEEGGRRAGSAAQGRDVLQEMLECAAVYYADLATAACAPPGELALRNAFAEDELRKAAGRADAESWADRAWQVLDAIEALGANAQRRLCLDDLFSRLGRAPDAEP